MKKGLQNITCTKQTKKDTLINIYIYIYYIILYDIVLIYQGGVLSDGVLVLTKSSHTSQVLASYDTRF